MAKPLPDIDALAPFALKPLTIGLLEENARLASENAALRDEVARLKGLKGKPDIKPSKPSGLDKATDGKRAKGGDGKGKRRGRKGLPAPHEKRVVKAEGVPPGSRFKGFEPFTVQDLAIEPRVVRYLRERWLAPDGRTIIAPLPGGVDGHFGPELKRFVLAQYHQGQTTVGRLTALLETLGLAISERQVMRLLIRGKEPFIAEARDVLRAGLSSGGWISVDDTGARHRGRNRTCTQIGPKCMGPLCLLRHHGLEKPAQFPVPAARRTYGLRPGRRGIRLHAGAQALGQGHRAAGRPSRPPFRGRGGVGRPSGRARGPGLEGQTRPGRHRQRRGAVGGGRGARVPGRNGDRLR